MKIVCWIFVCLVSCLIVWDIANSEGVVSTDDPTDIYYVPYVPYPKGFDTRDREKVIEYNRLDKINYYKKKSEQLKDDSSYCRFKIKELEARIEILEEKLKDK